MQRLPCRVVPAPPALTPAPPLPLLRFPEITQLAPAEIPAPPLSIADEFVRVASLPIQKASPAPLVRAAVQRSIRTPDEFGSAKPWVVQKIAVHPSKVTPVEPSALKPVAQL